MTAVLPLSVIQLPTIIKNLIVGPYSLKCDTAHIFIYFENNYYQLLLSYRVLMELCGDGLGIY